MPDPVTAIVGGGAILGGIVGNNAQERGANMASAAQSAAAQSSIAEQRRQFDAMQALMAPYAAQGTPAVAGQQNLLGLSGAKAQQSAINGIQNSPQFGAMVQHGENAMMQNASATGGLRGGNFQGAMAQFRPQILSQMIDQQFNRLGGMAAAGQNAAAGLGAAGMNMAGNIGNAYGDIGQAQAGAYLARGQSQANMANLIPQAIGMGAGAMGGGGMRPAAPQVDWGSVNIPRYF